MSACESRLFINGAYCGGSGKRIPQINPASECPIAEAESAALGEVDRAVCGAQEAFEKSWRDQTPGKRADILFRIAAGIRRQRDELALTECRNIGKPIVDAREEIDLGARIFEYYGG